MELSWFESLLYGLISGFTEFLPVSAGAHQAIYTELIGARDCDWLRLAVHIGALLALISVFLPTFIRYRRERKIARMPKNRRRRQPDFAALSETRLLRTAAVFLILLFLGYRFVYNLYERLWVLALMLGINGILLYIPQYLPGANKSAESMSSLDGMLIGITAGFGIVPGISRISAGMCTALVRGADRRYAADLCLMLSVPAMIAMIVMDLIFGIGAAVALEALTVLCCITAGAAAFGAAYLGIKLVRFLSYRAGFNGLAFYSWGLALFTLIIYLI